MQRYKQLLAMFMAFVLAFTCVPMAVSAETQSEGSAAAETISYEEDFSKEAAGWEVSGNDKWGIADGKLTASWTVGGTGTANTLLSYENADADSWENYTVSADVTIHKYDTETLYYPEFALCTYSSDTERFEVRTYVTSAGYNFKLYRRTDSSKAYMGTTQSYVPDVVQYGNDTVSFNLKVAMSDQTMVGYLDGAKAFEFDLSTETELTKGTIGFFVMRGSQAQEGATVKVDMDNVKVVSTTADSGEESPFAGAAFYDAANWQFVEFEPEGVIVGTVEADNVSILLDGSQKANAAAAYVAQDAQAWSNYRFTTDLTVSKTPNGNYTWAALRAYSQGATVTDQSKENYEYRIKLTGENSFGVQLVKTYLADGNRKVQSLASTTYAPKEATGYGQDTVTYNAGLQVLDGVITGYIDGIQVITYDTAKESADWGGVYESGSVGICNMRMSGDNTAGYLLKASNMTVEEAAASGETEEPEKPEDNVPASDSVVKNDENFLIVYYDDFASYEEGSVGNWTWQNTDKGMGEWRINNGVLVNGTDDGSLNTIALAGETLYPLGSVITDVMLTSAIPNKNLYAGLVAAYNGGMSYYHLRLADMADGSNRIQLYRMKDGGATLLQSVDLEFELKRNEWYQIELSVIDGVLYGYLDGTLYITYDTKDDDTVYTLGAVGVRSSQGAAMFDNFAVRVAREDASINQNFDKLTDLSESCWTDEHTDKSKGQWSVSDGTLVQSDENAKGTYIMLYDDGQDLTFGGASADIMFTSVNTGNLYAGPVLAYNGALNYYHVRIADRGSDADKIQLYKMINGGAKLLMSVDLTFKFERNTWYNVEMYQYGGNIYGYIDDVLYLVYDDPEEIEYKSGLAGVRVSQGSTKIDNFVAYGAAAEGDGTTIIVNDTVVENPLQFTDDFEDETTGQSPDYWLENNKTEIWDIKEVNGNKVYAMDTPGKTASSWLHVFETNVDMSAKLYVASEGTDAAAQAGLILRLSGLDAEVRAAYDFTQNKWYVRDDKGLDFEGQTIYAAETSEFALDTWHTVRARVVDCRLQVWCDDVLVLETDKIGQITTGRVAVYTDKAILYADDVKVELLSGQGRVTRGVLEDYQLIADYFSDGGSIFWYSDEVALFNFESDLWISEDQGDTFRKATAEEKEKYAFFMQSRFTQYIELHNGYILKIDNYTGGKAYLTKDRGATYEEVGQLWDKDDLPSWGYYGGMNDMIKEVNLGDIDGDGQDNYRVFYCADARAYGNPQANGSISHHWEEVYYTDDFGYTWHKSEFDTRWVSALGHICESRIVGCDDGTLRMYCTWNESPTMRYFVSYDYGETWQKGEYAIPQIRCPRSSLAYDVDENGTIYMVFVYTAPEVTTQLLRDRYALIRSTDGKNWEYIMDVWRWEDVPGDRLVNIHQIVNPTITVTDDFIFVGAGWSQRISDASGHNDQRQTYLKIDKSQIEAYEEWPDDYTNPDDIVHIEITAPDKILYKVGEELDVTGGYLTVYYYDGSTKEVPLTDAGVEIQEPTESINYTTVFPAPDMSVAGQKILRVTYQDFADNYTILVVDDNATEGSAGDVEMYPLEITLSDEKVTAGSTIQVANEVSEYNLLGVVLSQGGNAVVTVNGTALTEEEWTIYDNTFDGQEILFGKVLELTEGDNTIEIAATDATGNEAKFSFTVVRAKAEGGSGEGGSGTGGEGSGSGSGSEDGGEGSGSGDSGNTGSGSGSDSGSTDSSSESTAQPAAPQVEAPAKTGDNTNVWIWMFAAAVSVMAVCSLKYFGRGRKEE